MVDEVAPGTIRALSVEVELVAQLRLVFGVPADSAQLSGAVGELALGAVFALAGLAECAAQLCLVAGR